MSRQCQYCGGSIPDGAFECPHCGAPTEGGRVPVTIQELQQWYAAMGLPPENVTRFFIGKDVHEARAFGIFRDSSGNYVVYKNKNDGTRAVRYRGTDESHAVRELYERLKAEVSNQKANIAMNGTGGQNTEPIRRTKGPHPTRPPRRTRKSGPPKGLIIAIVAFIIICIAVAVSDDGPSRGYYNYDGGYYYVQNDDWYYYNRSSGWSPVTAPSGLYDNYDDYYVGSDYSGFKGVSNFENSSYYDYDYDSSYSSGSSYDSGSSYSSDSGSSWDWGSSDSYWDSSDSWDSGGSDWDSDWKK